MIDGFVPAFKLLVQLLMVAVIKAPFTLLQKPVEVPRRDAIEPPKMPLRLVLKFLNSINVMPSLGHEDLAVVHAPVVTFQDIQHIMRGKLSE